MQEKSCYKFAKRPLKVMVQAGVTVKLLARLTLSQPLAEQKVVSPNSLAGIHVSSVELH